MPETVLGMYNRKSRASCLHFRMKKQIVNEVGRLMTCVLEIIQVKSITRKSHAGMCMLVFLGYYDKMP